MWGDVMYIVQGLAYESAVHVLQKSICFPLPLDPRFPPVILVDINRSRCVIPCVSEYVCTLFSLTLRLTRFPPLLSY